MASRSLLVKFLFLFVPVFALSCAVGLFALAHFESLSFHNNFSARIGSMAGRIASALERHIGNEIAAPAQDVLDTLLADLAIECGEIRMSGGGELVLVTPRGLGCRGRDKAHAFTVPIGEEDQLALTIRYSDREVVAATTMRRELSLIVLLCGMVIACLASWVGFRRFIGTPLTRLLTAIDRAPEGGTREVVPTCGHDEIAVVTRAYNTLQSRVADFHERLEERVAERTFAAEQARESERQINIQLKQEIGERKSVEKKLISQREGLMRQQVALGKLIRNPQLADSDSEGALRMLMEATSRSLETERVSTWLFDQERRAIDCVDLFVASSNEHSKGATLSAVDFPRYFAALKAADHIATNDAHADPRTSEFSSSYLTPLGITSMLDVPIMREGRVAGVLCIEHVGAPIDWQPEQQVFATAVASLVSLVLEGCDRLQIMTELRASNIELEAATKAKTEFLATMSHEIRTPMNGVLGTIGLLLDTTLANEQQRLALTARRSAEGLLLILNDILDYSKLDAGEMTLGKVDFSPAQVIDDVASLLGAEASQKSLSLKVAFAPDFPMWVSSDPHRLRQVLFNLIANAIKFTDQGSVDVGCSWQSEGDERGTARFEIADTGIGIPNESIKSLFSRFTQVDNSSTRRFGGTGLGLAISKQLVELMGGRIGVTTMLGEGSTFWFEVPWCRANPELQSTPGNVAPLPVMPRKLLVLVVDDNSVNRSIVEMLLQTHGHKVDAVANGREAVEAVQTATYDLVLMDVQMPEMDGTTATCLIRKLPAPICHIPIIALTAHALPGHREEYLAAGMNDYVAKPLRALELFTAMMRVLPGTDSPTAAMTSNTTEPVIAGNVEERLPEINGRTSPDNEKDVIASLPHVDRMILSGWSDGLDREMVRNLLDAVPDEAGLCLSDLKTAIAAGDLGQAKRVAHRLKGMAGNLGAARLARAARDLEIDMPDKEAATAKLEDLERTMSETLEELRMLA